MGSLWNETKPAYVPMVFGGFMELKITQRVENQEKPVTTSTTFMLTSDKNPTTTTDWDQFNKATVVVDTVTLEANLKHQGRLIEGIPLKSDMFQIFISTQKIQDFLNFYLVSPSLILQTRSTLWKKITLNFYLSKAAANVGNSGNLSALKKYADFTFICPPTVCGAIDSNKIPAMGAITINQYPGDTCDNGLRLVKKQHDKPGRYFIRGCAASEEDALRGTAVSQLALFLHTGAEVSTGSNLYLTPVIDVMGEMFFVRTTQPAGYVRVAAQRGKNPRKTEAEGGTA